MHPIKSSGKKMPSKQVHKKKYDLKKVGKNAIYSSMDLKQESRNRIRWDMFHDSKAPNLHLQLAKNCGRANIYPFSYPY